MKFVASTELDRVTAERDALQQRLNAADQRIDDFAGGECEWSREDDSGIWNSGCGETWSFHEDGPEENGMHFCHSCGKHLVVEVVEQEQDDDWHMNPCKQGHRDVGAAGGVAACNQCDEKIEAATTQEAFERWNASHPAPQGMKRFIRRKFEAWLILLAAKILMDRNVQRSPVVSRRDNSDMWAMAEKLEAIVTRIRKKYQ